MSNYIPVLLFLVVVLGLTGVMLAMVAFLGPKRTNPDKELPFETGNAPTKGDAR